MRFLILIVVPLQLQNVYEKLYEIIYYSMLLISVYVYFWTVIKNSFLQRLGDNGILLV